MIIEFSIKNTKQNMKSKLIVLAVATALSCGAASAVTLTTSLISNSNNNVGLITTLVNGTVTSLSGSAFIYATSATITTSQLTGVTTRTGFEALILNDPGVVRSNITFTNGAVTSSASTELGAVGNKVYVWMQSTLNSNTYVGAFQGPNVPSLGAVTLNSGTMSDLKGTSVYSATGTSGFQLVNAIPEPSAALLGALGALGLLRRRRN